MSRIISFSVYRLFNFSRRRKSIYRGRLTRFAGGAVGGRALAVGSRSRRGRGGILFGVVCVSGGEDTEREGYVCAEAYS